MGTASPRALSPEAPLATCPRLNLWGEEGQRPNASWIFTRHVPQGWNEQSRLSRGRLRRDSGDISYPTMADRKSFESTHWISVAFPSLDHVATNTVNTVNISQHQSTSISFLSGGYLGVWRDRGGGQGMILAARGLKEAFKINQNSRYS